MSWRLYCSAARTGSTKMQWPTLTMMIAFLSQHLASRPIGLLTRALTVRPRLMLH